MTLPPFVYCQDAENSKHLEIRKLIIEESGAIYLGQWDFKASKREGMGIQVWIDGSMYEGYWSNNMFNGKGRLNKNSIFFNWINIINTLYIKF